MIHIIGVDPGKNTTGLCHFIYDVDNTKIISISIFKMKIYKALMKINEIAQKYPKDLIVLCVEDAKTNTGHKIEVVNGVRKRVYQTNKAQGAGHAKAHTNIFIQQAESSKQFRLKLISVMQTHNLGRIMQAKMMLNDTGFKVETKDPNKLEATICALVGFEDHTNKKINTITIPKI